MWIVWSRDSAAVSSSSDVRTSGRIPAKALSTSSRVGSLARYCPAVSRMNSTSSAIGRGSSGVSSMGVSVVPSSAWPCQGITKSTRPSLVRGTMTAESPWRNDAGSTRWAPWLGAMIGAASGSFMRRKPSLNGPVALTTARAGIENRSPVSASVASTPLMKPSSSLESPVTRT